MSPAWKYNSLNLTQWLVVLGIFTERYYELLLVLLSATYIYYKVRKFTFSKILFCGLWIVFLYSLIALSIVGYPYRKMFQQFVLIFLITVAYYQFFRYNKGHIGEIFSKYLKVAYIVSLLGIIQGIVYFFTQVNILRFLYYGTTVEVYPGILRITSIIDEPSYLGTLLTPAVIYYLLDKNNQKKRWHKYIIFLAVFMSFSTVTYFVVFLFLMYRYLIYTRNIFYRFGCIVLVLLLILFSDTKSLNDDTNVFRDIVMKVSDSFNAFSDMNPQAFESLNLSSYATMTNMWVAMNAPLRITGTGLGSHEQNYQYLYQSDFAYYGLNSRDGYSLANRIFSEFGLVGVIFIFILVFRYYNRENIINIAVLFLLITFLIRGGHYTRYGLVFFVFLYYYTSNYFGQCREKIEK